LQPSAAKVVQPLKALLANYPLLDSFVNALEKLTHPEHRFKDWMEQLKPLMKSKKKSSDQQKKIRDLSSQIYQDVFDPSIPNIGSYNKNLQNRGRKNLSKTLDKTVPS